MFAFGTSSSNLYNQNNMGASFEDLKCSFCKKYLTVPPIFTSNDGKINKCGRCDNQPVDKTLSRNETFEKLAKYMQFPCSESKNCKTILSWGTVVAHENVCPYRQIVCPHNKCLQIYSINTIFNHFQNNHIVYSGNIIMHNFLCKTLEPDVILIDIKGSYLLACFVMDDEFLWFNVYSLILQDCAPKFPIGFTSINCNIDYNIRHNIGKFPEKNYTTYNADTNKFHSIKLESLLNILDTDELNSNLTIKLEILSQNQFKPIPSNNLFNKPDNSENITLKALECPICYMTMSSYIYLCRTGHSVCANCKSKMAICPSCRAPFENGRNFTLEALYQKVKSRLHSPKYQRFM